MVIGEYLMVDDATLEQFKGLGREELTDKLFEVEESEEFEYVDIDRIWDVLHFVLTDVSAFEPIPGNKISEAIVGSSSFVEEDEDADFISYIHNSDLNDIITELENIDYDAKVKGFDIKSLQKNKIYPHGIWNESKKELIQEMRDALKNIISIYKKAAQTGYHIIVSIL